MITNAGKILLLEENLKQVQELRDKLLHLGCYESDLSGIDSWIEKKKQLLEEMKSE
ncbi:hypothetical protein ES703_79176 [subsurface metagenome]